MGGGDLCNVRRGMTEWGLGSFTPDAPVVYTGRADGSESIKGKVKFGDAGHLVELCTALP
jgi:hypothetical protein